MGKEYAGNTREAGSISGLGGPPGDRHPLEKATHSSILAWRAPWTEDPGGLYSPWGCKESDTTELMGHSVILHEVNCYS